MRCCSQELALTSIAASSVVFVLILHRFVQVCFRSVRWVVIRLHRGGGLTPEQRRREAEKAFINHSVFWQHQAPKLLSLHHRGVLVQVRKLRNPRTAVWTCANKFAKQMVER